MKPWQEILKGNLAYPKWNMLTLTISSIWSVVYQNFVWCPLCILFTSFGLWLFQTRSCDAESMSGWCPESLWCWFTWGPRLASSQPDFVMSLSTYCAGYRRKGTTLIFRNLHTKNGNTQYGMCNCCYYHISSRKGYTMIGWYLWSAWWYQIVLHFFCNIFVLVLPVFTT